MRILITGGAGYIGSHAVRHFSRSGHSVVVYDNLSRGHPEAVPHDSLIEGELIDAEKLGWAMKKHQCEGIVHFAGLTYVGESVEDPAQYYRNNVMGTLSLLDAARACGIQRIVFSSTAAVYGTPDHIPILETADCEPINPYGRTKHSIEEILEDYSRAYGIGYAALRYFNAAGADPDGEIGEDHSPESHLIPLVLQVALGQRRQIDIFGQDYPTPDGTCIRDYVHVTDLAAAHLLALEWIKPGTGAAFNLGTGRGYSVREIINVCRQITGKAIRENVSGRRAGDPAELVASAQLAKQTLGWQPRFSDIDFIVKTAWDWHRQHPAGYAGEQ